MVFYIEEIYAVDTAEAGQKEMDWLVVGEANFKKCEELRDKGLTVFYAVDEKEKQELTNSYIFRNTLS